MRVWLDLFDNQGAYQATLNGVPIAGPVRGIQSVSYTPRGARLNAAGELSFSLPLSTRRATAINEGTFIRLWEDGRDQGLFIVGEGSESEDGTLATFRCSDLLEELRWSLLTGYVNSPALPLNYTATAIIALARDYALLQATGVYWTLVPITGSAGFYLGTSYVVEAASTLSALVDLCQQTGYGFRLQGTKDRVIEFGDLRGDSGLRLQRAGGDAARTPPDYLRPITGLAPQRDPQSITTLVVPETQGVDGATLRDIWNDTGSTILAGTEGNWHRTGPITDPWYDPTFPLLRRPRPDQKSTDGQDGWTYFVANSGALATLRNRWQSQAFSEIRPASVFVSDRRAAAAAVYRACVSYLQVRAAAHRVLAVTTVAVGDNRGIAGKDVQVIDHHAVDGVVSRDINEFRTVVDVTRSIDENGIGTDQWTVDNVGRPIRGDRHVISDTWRQMVSMAKNPRPVIYTHTRTYASHVPHGQSMTFTIPADPNQRRTQVLVHIMPGKDDAGSAPDFVLFGAGGYLYVGPDFYSGTGQEPFDADISYVPGNAPQPLGLDSQHDLACSVAVWQPGNITATVTISYSGLR
jgi:hypothetical protein